MNQDFQSLCAEILRLTGHWDPILRELPGAALESVRNSQNRTIPQVVGHMVDSASNNTHRIVHLQYRESPLHFPDYANLGINDRWIAIQSYQEEDWGLLVDLWSACHRHIAHVIMHTDPDKRSAIWVSALGEEISMEAMIRDFPRHFRLHLDEIDDLIRAYQKTKE
jgi:hypothetical protein